MIKAFCNKCNLEIKSYNEIRYIGKTVVEGYGYTGMPWKKLLCDKCLDEIVVFIDGKGDDNGGK